jgi:hypothetical protein
MMRSRLATASRLGAIAAVALFSLASAGNQNNRRGHSQQYTPPAPRAMAPQSALGLWRTSFGPVKIQSDPSKGPGYIMGVWVYQRGGQEVIGYFQGALRGNVLQFTWQEPAQPAALTGQGYLVFDVSGTRFNGKWWTTRKDRQGDWNGWRADNAQPAGPDPRGTPPPAQPPEQPNPYGNGGYGGSTYGNPPPSAPPPPAPRSQPPVPSPTRAPIDA